jgi:hypothetical protein
MADRDQQQDDRVGEGLAVVEQRVRPTPATGPGPPGRRSPTPPRTTDRGERADASSKPSHSAPPARSRSRPVSGTAKAMSSKHGEREEQQAGHSAALPPLDEQLLVHDGDDGPHPSISRRARARPRRAGPSQHDAAARRAAWRCSQCRAPDSGWWVQRRSAWRRRRASSSSTVMDEGAAFDVERGERLVEQGEPRALHQGEGQGEAAASCRRRRRLHGAVGGGGQPDAVEQAGDHGPVSSRPSRPRRAGSGRPTGRRTGGWRGTAGRWRAGAGALGPHVDAVPGQQLAAVGLEGGGRGSAAAWSCPIRWRRAASARLAGGPRRTLTRASTQRGPKRRERSVTRRPSGKRAPSGPVYAARAG